MDAADDQSSWTTRGAAEGSSRLALRVLVVDDEPALLRGLARQLRLKGFYRVETASTGEDALAYLAVEHFDVVITDLFMPGISGVEVAQACGLLVRPPLLWIMTATAETDLGREARAIAGDRFLTKPIDIDELTERIVAMLCRQKPQPDTLQAA